MIEFEINGTCEVMTNDGVCGEKVIPEITISNTTAFDGKKCITKYFNRYHTYWHCKKHGSVPAIVNGIYSYKPEDILGRFENEKDSQFTRNQHVKSGGTE